jgi:dTDP-4-dehydrorhamnose reductase
VKVLVIGAAGQLGRALVAAAPPSAEVVALTRRELDLADAGSIPAAVESQAPDLILNAAAYTAVDKAESDAGAAYAVNRDAADALAVAAAGVGARLVQVSTDFVFDGRTGHPYAPDAPTGPLGVYGASKLAGEQMVRTTLPEALIVRTAWVYAAVGANFVTTMLRLMGGRPEVRVVADQIGTPTHAASLAAAIWKLAAAGTSGLYHYTDAGVASWYDFAVAIQEEALVLDLLQSAVPILPIRTADYPTAAKRPSYSVLDTTSSYAALGAPAKHWRVELREALRHHKTLMGLR